MTQLYFNTLHASAMIYLVSSIFLFLRRKQGERSRVILASFMLITVINYIGIEISLYFGFGSKSVLSVPMLLLGVFMATICLIYPAEVISPKWTTFKRIALGCTPIVVLYNIYLVSIVAGVEYPPYQSLLEMFPHIGDFNVQFRLFICSLIFIAPFLLYYIPYTKKYNNTDRIWMRKYIIITLLKSTAYILVLTFESIPIYILYYLVSTITSLYLVYLELFVRIISRASINASFFAKSQYKGFKIDDENDENDENNEEELINMDENYENYENYENDENDEDDDDDVLSPKKQALLFQNLQIYLAETEIWRNPELTFEDIVKELNSNRTSLWKAILNEGKCNYNFFIAKIRIEAYIRAMRENPTGSYMDGFYEVGFRSKSTALRSFKLVTGSTPSEYFLP